MAAPNVVPLDSQLCFSLYGASMAINRVYKPMLDALNNVSAVPGPQCALGRRRPNDYGDCEPVALDRVPSHPW